MAEEPVANQQIARFASSKLPKLLMLTHAMGGGVARHLSELSDALQGRALVVVMRPAGKLVRLSLPGFTVEDQELQVAFQWPGQKDFLWQFLLYLGVSQVHVHHVLNWPADFWPVFFKKVTQFDLTLHDHCIFGRVKPEHVRGKEERQWLARAQRCFDMEDLREAEMLYDLAVKAKRVLLPSHLMSRQLLNYFPDLSAEKIQYRAHLEAEFEQQYPMPFVRPLQRSQALKVLCLGMLSAEKGAQVLARVAREAEKQGLPLEFHLLGSCHVHLPGNIRRHGSYADEQVPDLLEAIAPHVLWLPAQCPETWSYTLSAGLKAGLPVVATRLGVFPERLQQRPLSWLCDVDSTASQWLGLLTQVRESHLAAEVRQPAWRSTRAEAFYTASQGGYLNNGLACLEVESTVLAEWQISQALVLGLPEGRSWNDRLLHVLLKLKYLAVLAPLVRVIPYAWQRRVKRLISRAPVHEPESD